MVTCPEHETRKLKQELMGSGWGDREELVGASKVLQQSFSC